MLLYTGRYSYKGADRLDITIKGNDPIGRVFAPTWELVKTFKSNKIDWFDYTFSFVDLLHTRLENPEYLKVVTEEILTKNELTLVCFCRTSERCHRSLVAIELQNLYDIEYMGER